MPGFPVRPLRGVFGPDPINKRPVRDSARELDGEVIMRAIFHQVSGLGMVAPLVVLACTLDNPVTQTIAFRDEAWNPRRLTAAPYDAPVIARTGAGIYTVDWTTPVPDEAGTDVALNFRWPLPFSLEATGADRRLRAVVTAANQVTVYVRDGAGSLIDDEDVLLLVG